MFSLHKAPPVLDGVSCTTAADIIYTGGAFGQSPALVIKGSQEGPKIQETTA
jgi:hypothetical protein